jgi:hypothetical protein
MGRPRRRMGGSGGERCDVAGQPQSERDADGLEVFMLAVSDPETPCSK